MAITEKPLLRTLRGESLDIPPVWMMRQAGRYLPEYRAVREKAGSFLDLCYNPDLAAEVTLQPIRRYGFDAAIIFADILLIPQALGLELSFVQGEGPRLSTIRNAEDLEQLRPAADIHETVSPVYETVSKVAQELPPETSLIGFAGAPWTVATYMIAGKGTPDQAPAKRLMYEDRATFDALIDRITDATILYLLKQIEAGAEAIKIFDSWAGALPGTEFWTYAVVPARRIIASLKAAHPEIPVIGFPRGAGEGYLAFAGEARADAIALDTSVSPEWAARNLQSKCCVQGNLDPLLLVLGGETLAESTRKVVDAFAGGPHIFNLGHGITPDASPKHVDAMLKAIRG